MALGSLTIQKQYGYSDRELFGAKLDLSIDESGMARLEKLSFDAYNESDVLIGAIERYRKRTGHYPERAHADKIYRNRENLAFCKLRGIRLSDPSLGIPKRNALVDSRIMTKRVSMNY